MNRIHSDLCCMILSGGDAFRAGGINKSFTMIKDQTILDHQASRLSGIIAREGIIVVTDRPEDYVVSGLRCVGDTAKFPAGKSSMRGMHSALAQAPTEWVFVLANDMPWPNSDVIERMLTRLGASGAKGICLQHDGHLEPMHAIYHRSLKEELRGRLESGDRTALSLQRWIADHPEIERWDASEAGLSQAELEECTANFNTGVGQD